MNDWADGRDARCGDADVFPPLLVFALNIATESLKTTPEELEVLAKAGVVDAGAQGFVALLEGFLNFVETGKIEPFTRSFLAAGRAKPRALSKPAEIALQFCTQALVVGSPDQFLGR